MGKQTKNEVDGKNLAQRRKIPQPLHQKDTIVNSERIQKRENPNFRAFCKGKITTLSQRAKPAPRPHVLDTEQSQFSQSCSGRLLTQY